MKKREQEEEVKVFGVGIKGGGDDGLNRGGG
jgi:hypothetical protein